MPDPDAFGLAVWALHDEQKTARATRPPDGFPAAGAVAPTGDAVTISDPDAYVAAAVKAAEVRLEQLVQGERNAGLNNVAMSLGHLVGGELLDYEQVSTWLEDTAHALWSDADTGNVRGTIRSGLSAGMRQPLDWVQGEAIPAAVPFTLPDDARHLPGLVALMDRPNLFDPADRHALAVASEVATQRARREAKRLLDDEEALASFREPPSRFSVREELLIADEPVTYAIEKVLPVGGNALLTAQYKTGKTTVVGDLAAAHADGSAFLDQFAVAPLSGRLAIFNYELSDTQYRRWLRELEVAHPERLAVLHLRGFRLPIIAPRIEDWVVRWLVEREVQRWVVDPFARAFTGCGDENDNGDVGRFLDTLDVIKQRAGVSELILPAHTGRMEHEEGQERARGATRLDDWADVRWMLNAQNEVRFFSATGRDVDLDEEELTYDDTRRRLHFGGHDRAGKKRSTVRDSILAVITERPGINAGDLRDAVRAAAGKAGNTEIDRAVAGMDGREIEVKPVGKTKQHYIRTGLATGLPTVPDAA